MIQRRTQTDTYWEDTFDVADADVGYVYDMILDEGTPVATSDLALALIDRNCHKEEEAIRAEMSRGPAYQPKNVYEVGQTPVFSALGYVLGTVVSSRTGRSPEYGEFTVVEVQIEGEAKTREFASALQGRHRLNLDEDGGALVDAADLMSPAELYEKHGELIEELTNAALDERDEFVQFGEQWFLRDLMVPISEGHLNIAEALIEIKTRPLPTTEFLEDLDLPAEVEPRILELSLSSALKDDHRFDNVGDAGRDIWYLRRLTPDGVVDAPPRLRLRVEAYDRQDIDQSLLLIEREIDDEGSGEDVMGTSRPLYRTTISLTYPHWRSGTLPLTVRTRGLFPQATAHHFPIVLLDGQSGDRMQGWVVHGESFVSGLGQWYERHKLPVGVFIKLERTRDPRVVTVDIEPRRLQSMWIPVASALEGKLMFHMRKTAIACEYDEKLAIGEENAAAIDVLWDAVAGRGESLTQTMVRIMPELIKLSPQGTVHSKTIYSAANVLRRTPPGPLFAVLSREPCFVGMGGGYWTFDEALV